MSKNEQTGPGWNFARNALAQAKATLAGPTHVQDTAGAEILATLSPDQRQTITASSIKAHAGRYHSASVQAKVDLEFAVKDLTRQKFLPGVTESDKDTIRLAQYWLADEAEKMGIEL
jgi:hypothetical protein